jgi:hypothetical protein
MSYLDVLEVPDQRARQTRNGPELQGSRLTIDYASAVGVSVCGMVNCLLG